MCSLMKTYIIAELSANHNGSLEKALELRASNIDAARTLMNIYSAIGETDKFKAMKVKVEEMEANAGGN